MRTSFLFFACASLAMGCGDGTTSTSTTDASIDQGSTNKDGAAQDSTLPDGAVPDSAAGDSSVPYEAGALDQCNPNDPTSCTDGLKCCSEPTHQTPPTAYRCVQPTSNGGCPMQP